MSRPLKNTLAGCTSGGRLSGRTGSVAAHQLCLEKQQQQERLDELGQGQTAPGRRRFTSPPLPFLFCGSGLEGSSERCRRIFHLCLIYFIAGVPELLCWLQHRIWNFPPEQFFILATHGRVALAHCVTWQGLSWCRPRTAPQLPCQLLSQGARGSCQRAKPTPLSGGGISNVSSSFSPFCLWFLPLRGGRERGQPCFCLCLCFHHSWCGFISVGTHITFYLEVMERSQASDSKLGWVLVPDLPDGLPVGPWGGGMLPSPNYQFPCLQNRDDSNAHVRGMS